MFHESTIRALPPWKDTCLIDPVPVIDEWRGPSVTTPPTNTNEFLDAMQRSRESLEHTIENRGQRELTELRDEGGWTVKDHLSHIAAWERGMIYLLQKRPRHEGMGVDETSYLELDADGINQIIFVHHKDLPLSDVMATFHDVHRDMLDLLSTLTWEDLQQTYSYYAPDEPGEDSGDPVAYWVCGNTKGHFEEHREWIERILEQGRRENEA
jgi:hypothetical protein